MTLKEAKIGSTVTVTKVGGEGALKRRIMDMGITNGVLRAEPAQGGRRSHRGQVRPKGFIGKRGT